MPPKPRSAERRKHVTRPRPDTPYARCHKHEIRAYLGVTVGSGHTSVTVNETGHTSNRSCGHKYATRVLIPYRTGHACTRRADRAPAASNRTAYAPLYADIGRIADDGQVNFYTSHSGAGEHRGRLVPIGDAKSGNHSLRALNIPLFTSSLRRVERHKSTIYRWPLNRHSQ